MEISGPTFLRITKEVDKVSIDKVTMETNIRVNKSFLIFQKECPIVSEIPDT